MTKATDISIDPHKEKGKIVSYIVFCILHDKNIGNGSRRVRFSLGESFVKKLPKAKAAMDAEISKEVKARIKQEHKNWGDYVASQNAKTPPIRGTELKTKLGFTEMTDADFQ